jgi:hypothetical protein
VFAVFTDDIAFSSRATAEATDLPGLRPGYLRGDELLALTTRDPFADGDFAAAQPGWNDDAAATQQRARDDPSFQQVYLRYFGGAS